MKSFAITTILSLLWLASSVAADPALDFVGRCQPFENVKPENSNFSLEKTFDTGLCWGAFDTIQNLMRLRSETGPFLGVCLPAESTRVELIRIFLQFVKSNPKHLHDEFAFVAQAALEEAFPCK